MDDKEEVMSGRLTAQRFLDVPDVDSFPEPFIHPQTTAGSVRDETYRSERESLPRSMRCRLVSTAVPHPLASLAGAIMRTMQLSRREPAVGVWQMSTIRSNSSAEICCGMDACRHTRITGTARCRLGATTPSAIRKRKNARIATTG
jgi:hypothetical protein